MKLFIFLLLNIFSKATIAQQNTNTEKLKNKQAFVYSFNGLNMRDSASSKANIIKVLNFGDTLQIMETTIIKCPPISIFTKDTVTNNDVYNQNPITENLILSGVWVKVKSKTMEGFVNSIYLSALPHLKNIEKKWEGKLNIESGNDNSALEDQTFLLLNKHFGIANNDISISKKALLYKKKVTKKDDLIEVSFTKKYKNGLVYAYSDSYYDSGVGGYTIKLSKKGIGFNEAIIYCRAFFYNTNTAYKTTLGFYIGENGKFVITSYGEGGGCTGEVYKNKGGDWVITYGCGGC